MEAAEHNDWEYHWLEGDSLAPPCPAETEVIQAILQFAKLQPDDVLLDLGCGDGRIPIEASKRYGVRSAGIEIVEQEISKFRQSLDLLPPTVQNLITPVLGDLEVYSFDQATVLIIYLLPEAFVKIQSKLTDFLSSGENKRIICNTWGPSREILTPISTLVCGPFANVNLYLYDHTSIVASTVSNIDDDKSKADEPAHDMKASDEKPSSEMKRKLPRSWSSPKYPYLSFPGQIILISSTDKCDIVCAEISSSYRVIGFDIEWKVTFQHNEVPRAAALVQICGSEEVCYLFQLTVIGSFPASLARIVCDENIKKVGANIHGDESKLLRDYPSSFVGLTSKSFEDLSMTFKLNKPDKGCFISSSSLAYLCERFLQLSLDKDKKVRISNWEKAVLSDQQLKYAAADAYASWKVYLAILQLKSSIVVEESVAIPVEVPVAVQKIQPRTDSAKKKKVSTPRLTKMKRVVRSPQQKVTVGNDDDDNLLSNDAKRRSPEMVVDETILSELSLSQASHNTPPPSPHRPERTLNANSNSLLSPKMELDDVSERKTSSIPTSRCPVHYLPLNVTRYLDLQEGVVLESDKSKASQLSHAITSVYRMFYVEKKSVTAISFDRMTQISTTHNYLLEAIDQGVEYDSRQFEISASARDAVVWAILQTQRGEDGIVHIKAKPIFERLQEVTNCEGCKNLSNGSPFTAASYWQIFFVMKHLRRKLGDGWHSQIISLI